MSEKKISYNNQKDNKMNSKNELKLKITHLFNKLNPKNQEGFMQKMKEFDVYSKIDLTEEELSNMKSIGGKPKVPSDQNGAVSSDQNGAPPSPNYPPPSPNYPPPSPAYGQTSPVYGQTSPVYGQTSPVYAAASPYVHPETPPYQPSPTYQQTSPQYQPKSPDHPPPPIEPVRPPYQPSPTYQQTSPQYQPKSPDHPPPPIEPVRPPIPTFLPPMPKYPPGKTIWYKAPVLEKPLAAAPAAQAAQAEVDEKQDSSNSESDDFGLDDVDLDNLEVLDVDFLENQADKEQYFVSYVAISEGETIYRKDEIVSDLLDEFRDSEASKIFTNEVKLKMWIDEILQLVDNVSTKDLEGNITGVKSITNDFKPIVDNFTTGKGTGVSWIVPVSEEKKKIYDAGDDGAFYYSADSAVELKKEQKVIEANPTNVDPETQFKGYDHQQRTLYGLSKPYNDGDDALFEINKLERNKEVYYFTSVIEGDKYELGKRVLDKGVYRVQNRYENIGKKKSMKKSEPQKQYETLGRKRLVDVEEVEIVEPDVFTVENLVLTKPGGRKLKPVDGFYQAEKIQPERQPNIELVNPFRSTDETYVLFREKACILDPYHIGRPLEHMLIDSTSLPISTVKSGDKLLINSTHMPYYFNFKEEPNVLSIPMDTQMLVQVSDLILGQKKEDGLYHYFDHVTHQKTTSTDLKCMLHVTPILGNMIIRTAEWEQLDFPMFTPRVDTILKNDSDTLSEGDTCTILLTDMFYDKYVLKKDMNFIDDKNPYFISNNYNPITRKRSTQTYNHLTDSLPHINHYGICKVNLKDEKNIELEIIDEGNALAVGTIITCSLAEFSYMYLSKNIEKAIRVLTSYNKSEEDLLKKMGNTTTIRRISRLEDIKSDKLIWGKIIKSYPNGIPDSKISSSQHLVQVLQPTDLDYVSSFVLMPEERVEYSVTKYVFERGFLAKQDQTLGGWLKGLIDTDKLEIIVPTVQEFLNKISKKLINKETIHFSFIQDLSKLALDYEKYEITESVKEKLTKWIEHNIVKHVEDMAFKYVQINKNYSELLEKFESSDELDPEKFRLTNTIEQSLLDYSNWSIDESPKDYSKIKNVELVGELERVFIENTNKWENVEREELSEYQSERLLERQESSKILYDKDTQYEQYEKLENRPKTRNEKLLESIKRIPDISLRNRLLTQFIEKQCYLATDPETGGKWYFSKIDLTPVKLICPHIYAELTNQSLDEYTSESLKDGTVVCKNCGEMLNTMTFSYFEGYDEADKSRGAVLVTNGVEHAGTMIDTEIITENATIYLEADNPEKYIIEMIMNRYIALLPEKINKAISDNRELRTQAIDDCEYYLLTYDIADFETWFQSVKSIFMKGLKAKKEHSSKTDEQLEDLIRRDKTITSRHIKFLEDKRVTVILARLAIIVEKQLDNSGKTAKEIIDYLIDSSEERRLEKDKKEIPTEPKVIDKLKRTALEDYSKFTSSEHFLTISELYKRSESEYKETEEKKQMDEEAKFKDYTEAEINADLTLFDAINWLKSFIRKSHTQQKVEGILSEKECVLGTIDFKSYGTEKEQSNLIEKLEIFITEKMPKEENRTGVKSRKQFYSDIVIEEPLLDQVGSDVLEAKIIIKNLYDIQTNLDIMKKLYDKTTFEQKRSELTTYLTEILANLPKYRLIDYLVSYTLDPITKKVVKRRFENELDIEQGILRTEIISNYISMGESQLLKETDILKQSEIEIKPELENIDVAVNEPKKTDVLLAIITKISEKLKKTVGSKSGEVEKVIGLLTNLEKEYVTDKSKQKEYVVDKLTEVKDKKIALYKEYERLTKMLTYLKRDYNYLVNNVNLRDKKSKLAEQTGYDFEKDDYLENFETDYDYIIKYIDEPDHLDFKDRLHRLLASDLELIEIVNTDKLDELEKLVERNTRNKFLFCATILKIILQFIYEWDDLKPDTFDDKAETDIDIVLDEEMDSQTAAFEQRLCDFIIDFIKTIDKVLRREEEVLIDLDGYKDSNFQILKQVERDRRTKYSDRVGKDLIKEFNKVMKGTRVLEISSDHALESAKPVEQERYEENPNGKDNYGAIFDGDLEGENEYDQDEENFDLGD
jgi:hypothetical protein